MLKGRSGVGEPSVRLNRENLPRHGARRGAFHLPGDVFGLESGAAHRLAAE
jgi:hypothetical protein